MKEINAITLKNMFINGANKIADNFEYINELNVFPIPDGDTGTNLKITVTEAIKDIAHVDSEDISILGKNFSRALLMNARGNSGVIFSQIIKGFVSEFKENQTILSIGELSECFRSAKRVAYGAVANPIEGTILTVIRCVAEFLSSSNISSYKTVDLVFKDVVKEAKKALDNTPNLLEELKRVGVVDSGGCGLYLFLLGMAESLKTNNEDLINKTKSLAEEELKNYVSVNFDEHDYEEGFGYCSEIIMKTGAKINPSDKSKKEFNFNFFKSELEKMGDSLVCVQDSDLVKVHIHTFNPGNFLNFAQQYGEFVKVKFENMTEQYYERISRQGIKVVNNKDIKMKDVKLQDKQEIILSCPSSKIKKILANEYGLKNVINTEKTGNPSTKDLLMAVQKTHANKVFIITDDTNIVLAANQAKEMVKDNIEIRIIKGSNIFEALIASLEFNPKVSMETNERVMNLSVEKSLSSMVSRAVKAVKLDNLEIKVNDHVGIVDKRVQVSDSDELIVLKSCVDLLMKKTESADVLMVFYSSKTSLKVLKQLETYVAKKYELICDFKEGGQKVYSYMLGIQ